MSRESCLLWPDDSWADQPFLVAGDRAMSHREVAQQVAAASSAIPIGGHVLVRAAMTLDCIVAIIACWTRSALAVIVDGREPEATIASIRTDSGSLEPAWDAAAVAVATQPRFELALDPLAIAIRTSGSVATPKLAAHRLSSLVANARTSHARTPFGPGDRWLMSLSPHHIGGLSLVVRAMIGGGAIRIGRGPGGFIDDLRDDAAISHLSIVATQLRRALDAPEIDRRMRALRAILLGGGPAPEAWRNAAVERKWPLSVTYGLTECASQVTTSRAGTSDTATDAGMPLDGVHIRVTDEGEICVDGPTLFAGYLTRSELTSHTGEFATGDVGSIDRRGHLHVLGRRDSMFISGGENIRPEEIENVLREVPGITQACVVAIDDPIWQKRPIAFVVGSFNHTELLATLRTKLPGFKWPDRIHAMPSTEAAKAKPSRVNLAAAVGSSTLWVRPEAR